MKWDSEIEKLSLNLFFIELEIENLKNYVFV